MQQRPVVLRVLLVAIGVVGTSCILTPNLILEWSSESVNGAALVFEVVSFDGLEAIIEEVTDRSKMFLLSRAPACID
jgi:hypothetical protein